MVIAYDFTEDVRRSLATAREEAQRLRHAYVGTEHLALGVLRTAGGTAAIVLADVERDAAMAEIERRAGPCQSTDAPAVDQLYTSRGKRVLELAMREALEQGQEEVGIEHLLLGLLREDNGIGAKALRGAGLELETARAIVVREASKSPERSRHRRPSRLLLRFLDWAGWAPRR